jgi:hypothetical protein
MGKTIYGDGVHLVTVDDETRAIQFVEDRGDGVLRVVDMSERAFGEVVIGWHRWRERLAEGIPGVTVMPSGIDSEEVTGEV